jgi:nitrate reductase delta subunit
MELASPEGRRILRLFADLLAYPQGDLLAKARECESWLARWDPGAVESAGAFRSAAEAAPLARLEELYTAAFDLNAAWHPYVGYHLFGESYKRSAFLLGLKERYRAEGFRFEGELPDHLRVVLGFLSACADPSLVEEVAREAVLPTLERMLGPARGEAGPEGPEEQPASNPYRAVLESLRRALRHRTAAGERRSEAQGPSLPLEVGG